MQNRRLEPTCLAKPGTTHGLTGMGPDLARQEEAGQVFGRFSNRTGPFFQSKTGPLARYLDPLLTLHGPAFLFCTKNFRIQCSARQLAGSQSSLSLAEVVVHP
jgi:hypothetical protein